MGFLLNFFGAGGLQLKALIIGAAVALMACLMLLSWGLYQRGQYLACQNTTIALTAQVNVLGDKIDTQNESIIVTALAAQTAVTATEGMLNEAKGITAGNRGFLATIDAKLAKAVPKRADGTDKDCGDARRELRAERGRK